MAFNIGSLLSKRASISPQKEAFVEFERGRRFDFAQLNLRSNKTANALLAAGVKPGERVASLLKNGIEFIETYFATAKIGAVLVPVNWRLSSSEVAYILADSGARVLVYDSDFDALVAELHAAATSLPAIDYCLRCNADSSPAPTWAHDYDEQQHLASATEPPPGAFDDDLLFIMYTSGTTGRPKGAMHSHDGMLWSQFTSMSTSDMRGDDRFLLPLPMFHVGCLNPVSLLVHRGATGVILRELDLPAMFKCIEQERISIFMSVPVLLQYMLMAPEREQCSLASVRWIATGAAPVPVSLLQQYQQLDIAIYQAYGLTESCGPGTLLLPEDAAAKLGSCGRPQMHTEARVVDAKGNTLAPGCGEAGELLLSGRHMMLGYWNNPEATAATLVDGWLHTGDICTMDAEGFVTICDRLKDMIISGGENIYPAELENVLAACPSVQEAAVIGVASIQWGETPLALLVPAPGATPCDETVLAHCQQHLASYKVPRLFKWVELLPRNPSGKLLKQELRAQYPEAAPF